MYLTKLLSLLGNRKLIFYIIGFSVISKFSLLYILGPISFPDGNGYINIAELIYNNDFLFPNDKVDDAPITPYVYALFYPLTDIFDIHAYRIPNILLSTFTIYILFKISITISNEIRVSNIVAIIAVSYPFLNFYAITALTETIFVTLLYISFYFFVKYIKHNKNLYLYYFGVFFALSSLTRFSTLPMMPFYLILIVFIIYYIHKDVKKALIGSFVTGIIYIVIMLPWGIRNYSVSNKLSFTTPVTKSGLAFYVGNNPMNKTGGGLGNVDHNIYQYDYLIDNELIAKKAMEDSINWIKNNPKDWLILELRKIKRLYSVIFYAKQYQDLKYQLLSILSYGIILILFLSGLVRFTKIDWIIYSPMLLFMLLLTGLHMVTFASIRYRLPIEPFMIIVASNTLYFYLQILFKKYKNE